MEGVYFFFWYIRFSHKFNLFVFRISVEIMKMWVLFWNYYSCFLFDWLLFLDYWISIDFGVLLLHGLSEKGSMHPLDFSKWLKKTQKRKKLTQCILLTFPNDKKKKKKKEKKKKERNSLNALSCFLYGPWHWCCGSLAYSVICVFSGLGFGGKGESPVYGWHHFYRT